MARKGISSEGSILSSMIQGSLDVGRKNVLLWQNGRKLSNTKPL